MAALAPCGARVVYAGSYTPGHGPAEVLAVGACWCLRCNGSTRYQLAFLDADGRRTGQHLSHIRAASVTPADR